MSLALSSLRRRFVDHLTSGNSAAAFSSFRRRGSRRCYCIDRLSLLNVFSFSSAAKPKHQLLPRRNTAVFYCSTLPLNGGIGTADDSFTSPYLSVRVSCPRHVADVLSESLMCFGASSTTIDEEDRQNSDEEIWITSTFDVEMDVKICVARAADSVGLKQIPKYKVEMHDHTDWIKQTQESFHPVEITEELWIVPEWRVPPQAINIVLNPGLAFGTGEHPTTKLCLLMLHRLIKGGEYFLDYGTGSGVLAIAALKFGAGLSVGFDIEPQAIASARHNASLNNLGMEKLLLSLVPTKNSHFEKDSPHENTSAANLYNPKLIAEKDKYDVVIANILLYPLLDLADRIVSYAKPGAVIGISGIISEQVPTVMERYSQFLEGMSVSMMDDWACVSGFKKAEESIRELQFETR
ncbi:uncharacterized protein LOC127265908 isoform X2 [Andrographis paniculata]|uniref:uncharacterized protein LOC127265908 isoform X2 n=1 Tax=Andrographis paniculata TaxID=175694 RepID=UPI0021E80AB9|nr:uncharacterized protein LOC127265908 isoform X2 [Andrographis paniculata]